MWHARRVEKKCIQNFGWKHKEKDILEDIGVDGMMLKWNLKRIGGSGYDLSVSVWGKAVGSSDHSNGFLVSTE